MEMKGEQLVPAPRERTWAALNDPEVLKACVPGCESIEPTGADEYQVLMVARVGPVSAKFKGRLALSDIRPPESYAIAFEGQGGAAGFAKGGAKVRLVDEGGATRLTYEVTANVGGKLAQIGSRLVDAAAKKVADDFFRTFNERLSAEQAGSHGPEDAGHDGHDHHPAPIPPDPDLPRISNTSLMFFAGGALVIYVVALLVLT